MTRGKQKSAFAVLFSRRKSVLWLIILALSQLLLGCSLLLKSGDNYIVSFSLGVADNPLLGENAAGVILAENIAVALADGIDLTSLEMNGEIVTFSGGELLTVSCNMWNGPQSNNDYRFHATKSVVMNSDTTVGFSAADNTM